MLLHYLEYRPPPLFTYRPQKYSVTDPFDFYQQKGLQLNCIQGLQLKCFEIQVIKYYRFQRVLRQIQTRKRNNISYIILFKSLYTFKQQKSKNLLIFEEYFKKRGLQLKWQTKSDARYKPKSTRFALTYRPSVYFLKKARGSVSEQGWWSAFEVMQQFKCQVEDEE
ncbi:Hypothetical_protein [Hexamita inflata]|uniref:Hypothetical_protein n=1 Tax=Hexamita inflata TaxID=28002 RepID=A0AA86R466_9EUKA|nr:Hypothetical protein HINF_LOCUS50711 [Hexamita inflata]CAI9969052.1 Hypothetical protein HINF_LOCUS56697 [Hexamita inflata]